MENRCRRICCFCETWESGGIESFLCNTLLHMNRRAMDIDIVASKIGESVFTLPLQQAGIHFYQLSGSTRKLSENRRLFLSLLQTRKYHVVHLNLYQGLSLYYCRLAQQAGIPIRIVHSHNTALRKSPLKPFKLLVHWASSRLFSNAATDFWACSKPAAQFLFPPKTLQHYGFQMIPNGIDTKQFQFDLQTRTAMRKDLGLNDMFVIGHIGRLCDQKNQSFLLEAFAQVLRVRPQSRLLLIGEGPLRQQLENQARKLGISSAVIFYGSSKNIPPLLWAMDVFAFPSTFEGLGIVAIEAQAAGLAVICSEFIPQEAHITPSVHQVPLGAGAAGWAEALLCVSTDVSTRDLGANLVANAGFDQSQVAETMEAYYGGPC